MQKAKSINKEKGQSLFEIVMAIAISGLIMVAIVSLVSNSISGSVYSKNESAASDLAQKTTEWIRAQRDDSIQTFLGKVNPVLGGSPSYCFIDLDWSHPAGCSISGDEVTGTIFTRQGNFTVGTASGKTIIETKITVSWTDSRGGHSVVNFSDFSDWRER